MKVFNKLLVLGTMLLSIGFTNSKVNELYAVDTTIEDMKKYDENIELGTPYFDNGDFNSPFNGSGLLRAGDKNSELYRGGTSVNEKESDIYAFYDEYEKNTFVRMANFNGTGGKRTRISVYYYDTLNDKPKNVGSTDHFDVSFSYRLFASDMDKLDIKDNDIVFRWQSRGSAEIKTCDVLYKDLVTNEPGDYTWHTYSYRAKCDPTMTTEFGWFYFYYNDMSPSMNPTYYADIDNLTVTVDDEVNRVRKNGSFESVGKLTSTCTNHVREDELYKNFYYRPDYGVPAYQYRDEKNAFLRMDANSNKSTFTYYMNKSIRNEQVVYINFDYKNLSYYKDPDLNIMINGKDGTIYEDIIGKEVYSENYISYIKDAGENWKNQSIYLTLPAGEISTLDFLLEFGGDLAIDNLVMADFKSIDYSAGNYTEFKTNYDNFLETIGDYESKYVSNSIKHIMTAIKEADKITENSSQTKIDKAIELINTALTNLEERGDLDKLFDYIDQIYDEMAGTNKDDYDLRLYILFDVAVDECFALDEDSTKEEVDRAYENLKEAYENMTRKESE